jgi:ribonuclease PH
MKRTDGRTPTQLRKITIVKNYLMHPEGSCLISFGNTQVVCTATVENEVPPFLKGQGSGWVTAEYGMLPRSCTTRVKRNPSARAQEIQRLIGRSLRSVVDLKALGERTIRVDCDVLQADGGTRTASVTGGFVAVALACMKLKKDGVFKKVPLIDQVAAVSVGMKEGKMLLDLNYDEDSTADMDINVVMLKSGKLVEVQGTAEHKPFSKAELDDALDLARRGISQLIQIQKKVVKV